MTLKIGAESAYNDLATLHETEANGSRLLRRHQTPTGTKPKGDDDKDDFQQQQSDTHNNDLTRVSPGPLITFLMLTGLQQNLPVSQPV